MRAWTYILAGKYGQWRQVCISRWYENHKAACHSLSEKPRQKFVAGLKYCDVGSHLPTGDTRKDVSSRLENKANPVTHILESQGQPFSAWKQSKLSHSHSESQGQPFSVGLKTKQAQSLTFWRAKDSNFQQAWKQSKLSHSHSGEPRTTIFSRLGNKASSVTHILESQGQPFSAGLKTKQAQSLTYWRAKDNHFQQAWKQSKPSHSPPGEPRTTIFSRLENKASPVTHQLESQGQPFSAGLKTKQAQSLTSWRAKDNHFQQAWKQSKLSHSHSGEPKCYVTAGTFARRGLSSTAKTLRRLSGVRGSEY